MSKKIIIPISLILLIVFSIAMIFLVPKMIETISKGNNEETTTEDNEYDVNNIVDVKQLDKVYIGMPFDEFIEIMGKPTGQRATSHFMQYYKISDGRILSTRPDRNCSMIQEMGFFDEKPYEKLEYDDEEYMDEENVVPKEKIKKLRLGMTYTEAEKIIGKPTKAPQRRDNFYQIINEYDVIDNEESMTLLIIYVFGENSTGYEDMIVDTLTLTVNNNESQNEANS